MFRRKKTPITIQEALKDAWIADDKGREVVQWDRLRGSARVLADPARMVVIHAQNIR